MYPPIIGHYISLRPVQIFCGWATLLIGTGLFTLMSPSTPIPVTIPFQLIIGVGLGLLFANQNPVQAPHPEASNAAALSLLTFVRNFAQVSTSLSSLPALMFTPLLIVLGYFCRCNNTAERTAKTAPNFPARNDSTRGGLHVQYHPPDPDL